MNENTEKITAVQNSQDYQKIIQSLEADIEAEKQKTLDWHNAFLKSEENRLEEKKAKERAFTERDDWKREAHRNRRIELEQKQTKETNDFLTEFNKLQAAKQMKGGKN